MNTRNEYPWGSALSLTTSARIAAHADWQLNFSTVNELVDAMVIGESCWGELLTMASPNATAHGHRYTDQLLDMLCGDLPGRHLWQRDWRGRYHLLPDVKYALDFSEIQSSTERTG